MSIEAKKELPLLHSFFRNHEEQPLKQLKNSSHHVMKRVTATAAAPIEKQRKNIRFPLFDFAVIDRSWRA